LERIVRDKIRAMVMSNLNIFSSEVEFSDDDNIFRKGFVDSLFAVQLIAYLEQEFGIRVTNKDLNINNFHSVNKMVSFVERKRQEDGGGEESNR
jgi:methoxymalonate biosynthesis acyl carrier protein